MSISELVNFTMVQIDWFPMMFEFGWSLHVIGKNVSNKCVLFLQKYFYLIFLFDDSVISHKKIIYDL